MGLPSGTPLVEAGVKASLATVLAVPLLRVSGALAGSARFCGAFVVLFSFGITLMVDRSLSADPVWLHLVRFGALGAAAWMNIRWKPWSARSHAETNVALIHA
jgi:hypothetical protein